jgi:hypothetical protein
MNQARQTEGAQWVVPFARPVIVDALARRALVAMAQGELERAATLMSGVAALCEQSGYTLEAPLQASLEQAESVIRAQLAETALERAGETGRGMPLDQALAYALQT